MLKSFLCRKNVAPFLAFLISNNQLKSRKYDEKYNKYWNHPQKTYKEILIEADNLYDNQNYIQVYELLNRLKFGNNSEVKWRIVRVLLKIPEDIEIPNETEQEMVKEAYELLNDEATEDNRNANVHKWYAISCFAMQKFNNIEDKIKSYHNVLKHLRMAYELNQDDISVCYILGKFCFSIANLNGFKRFVAEIFYGHPPECTFQEAYKYLLKVEQLTKGQILSNIYLLGKTCYNLKQFYKAKHYLNMTCCMVPKSEEEKIYVNNAKNLLMRLEKFTLGKELLFIEDYQTENITCMNYDDQ